MGQVFDGRRILIVEDEYLVAMEVEAILGSLGAMVLGPYGRVEAALAAIEQQTPDGAVLDVRLDGTTIYQVAERLLARGVPIVLTTGYGTEQLPEQLQRLPLVRKPFSEQSLRSVIEQVFSEPC